MTKDNENLPLKTKIEGKNNLKITGYDSTLSIHHTEDVDNG